VICNAFESGHRQELYRQSSKLLDSYASNLCLYLKLSAAECVALAYCLTQSQFEVYAIDAHRIIRARCAEINNLESIVNINDDLLTTIGQYIFNSAVS